MNGPDSRPPLPAPLQRAAGAWLARRDRGLSPAEQADFDRWLAADPRHAQAIADLSRTFAAFDRIREIAPADVDDRAPDPDVFAPPRRARLLPWLPVATLAAAAALAFVWLRPAGLEFKEHPRDYTAQDTAERVTLADGSTIDLNRHTSLTVELSASARRVRLVRGEAHFQVAKDPTRPFVVDAAGVAAQALGTAFNVRLTARTVEVTVTEGRVKLAPPARDAAAPALVTPSLTPPVLAAGDHAVVPLTTESSAPVVAALDPLALEQRLAWQPRVLELHKTPLAEVVAQFNRRADSVAQPRLELREASLADLRIGGTVRLDQPDAFARLLERSFGLRAQRDGDTIVLDRAPN
jgi:transmembrane sensor